MCSAMVAGMHGWQLTGHIQHDHVTCDFRVLAVAADLNSYSLVGVHLLGDDAVAAVCWVT
jgi:hypothetical protein